MPLVRTMMAEGHTHVLALPNVPPDERSAFWTEEGGDDGHVHRVMYGGGIGPGIIETEEAGFASFFDPETGQEFPRGSIEPDAPDSSRPHVHQVSVLR